MNPSTMAEPAASQLPAPGASADSGLHRGHSPGTPAAPALLAAAIKSVTGVFEHGLFLDLADEALVSRPGGVEHLTP